MDVFGVVDDTAHEAALHDNGPKAATLVQGVERHLADNIANGTYAPGTKLPSEKELGTAIGVSRTVVREAIAQLRARGLVTTRQGLGAYVATAVPVQPLQFSIGDTDAYQEMLHIIQLRTAIECEAAALAATNASPDDLASIEAALDEMRLALTEDRFTTREDYAFHMQIAQAARNPHFPRVLEYLGQLIIPRSRGQVPAERRHDYDALILAEHTQIFRAIADGKPDLATALMRHHLLDGFKSRYFASPQG